MKLMIASDLHGSALYCQKLLDAFAREGADRLILLGDLLYHGPRNDLPEGYDPRSATALLNAVAGKLLCVRGNCDAEVDQMVLEFPILADCALIYADGLTLYATHGHMSGPDNPPPLATGDILLCGHTHLPVRRQYEGFLYLNPGSLSLPKEGTPHSYLTLEAGNFTWRDLLTGQPFQPLA